ncbi:MAG TPA: methyltransferase [Microthrixaceae bacterium]|nr:methyltransferase [Microthrixaceae bacterium]
MDLPEPDGEASVAKGVGHYFNDDPKVTSKPSTVRLTLPDLSVELHSDRGVFSSERIDPGTKVLLMELPELPAGAVVDVGCGYGPISTTLALRRPGQPIWAVDVNSRALELTRKNLKQHASADTPINVVRPEDVPEELRVSAIVSNPPIRVGKAVLHELLEFWLDRLEPNGEAWLVIQKHLGADSLAKWLNGRGFEVERIKSRQGYRLFRVTQPGVAQLGA